MPWTETNRQNLDAASAWGRTHRPDLDARLDAIDDPRPNPLRRALLHALVLDWHAHGAPGGECTESATRETRRRFKRRARRAEQLADKIATSD